jgi:hypothetical protein
VRHGEYWTKIYIVVKHSITMSNKLIQKAFANIDTVHGHCEECQEDSILVAIVSEFYRCTNCGADTRQHVNGSIRYIKLTESDKAYIKAHGQENL